MADLCGANRKQAPGKPCTRPAGWGTPHPGVGRCKLHGGNTPNHLTAAVGQQAAKELARLDVHPVADPLTELAKLAGQVCAWRDMIAEKVNELTDIRWSGEKTGEQLRSEVAVFERALDRCNTVLTAMARLNIDERLAKISEQQAAMVETAVAAALSAAGLDRDQQAAVQRALTAHLRAA